MKPRLPSLAAAAFVVVSMHVTAARVDAQLTPVGPTRGLFDYIAAHGPEMVSDVAYDPQRDLYLVISGWEGLWGTFVDGAGNQLTWRFWIMNPYAYDTRFAHNARVAYSPDLNDGSGGFLVTWGNRGLGGIGMSVKARIVAYPSGLVGSETIIWRPTEYVATPYPQIAYSRTSRQFLAVWSVHPSPQPAEIYARPIGLDGQPTGPTVHVGTGWVKAVVWHPDANEFAISYRPLSGDIDARFARLTVQGEVIADEAVSPSPAPSGYAFLGPDLALNDVSGNYVMVWSWYDTSGAGNNRFFTAEIDWQGNTLALGSELRSQFSTSLSFNHASRTFLVLTSCSREVCAVALNEHGERISDLAPITSSPAAYPAMLPRAASGSEAEWMVAFAAGIDNASARAYDQFVTTSFRDGGPAGVPLTDLCVGSDPFTFMGGGVCVNGGWVPWNHPAAQRGGSVVPPTPPPGGCTTPDPFTFFGGGVCVNGGWVPKDHPLAKR